MSQSFMMLSRELKMVSLDFSWALNKVWRGYRRECGNDECDGCKNCKNIEPPVGNGFQLWESVSEGSPISPVFESAEKLCRWLADTPRGHDITNHFSYAEWMKIINDACPLMDIHTNKLFEGNKP